MSKCLSTFRQLPSHYSYKIHGWLRESHLTDAKKIKYPYGKYNCWFPNHLAQQFPYHSALGCSQSPKKTNSGFFIIATECRGFKSNLSILYYIHNPQTLFMLILRVENSVSLHKRGLTFFWPYHCSLPEKPQSLLRQEDPGHRCVDQERASVPLRLPGRRNSITRGLIVTTELSYSFPSWSIHSHQLGCRDRKTWVEKPKQESWAM